MPIAIAKPKAPKRQNGHKGEARIVRRLPDGMYELEFGNGRRMRAHLYRCPECQATKLGDDFRVVFDGMDGLCVRCQYDSARAIAADRLAKLGYAARLAEEWKQRRLLVARLAKDRRASALIAATPTWVDRGAIAAIYAEARAKSLADGSPYHVDHIWPLQHPECCGLHVPWNLRVMAAPENCAKGNRLPTTS